MHIGLSASLIATIVQDINWLLKKEIRNKVQHILVFSVQESDSKLIEAIMARAELSVIMHLRTLGKAEGAPCLVIQRAPLHVLISLTMMALDDCSCHSKRPCISTIGDVLI